jgi:hypothetical protein
MAALNFTPISLYYSTTAAATPSAGNLVAGELALNTLDEKLYFKNSAGTVKLLASSAAAAGGVTSVAATVPSFLSVTGSPITTSGTLAFSLSGTALPTTSGGTGLTSFTSGGAVYASSTSALTTGTLPNTAGGTGQSSAFTQYGVTYASSTTALATTSAGTAGYVLTSNGSSAPTFQASSGVSTGKSIAMAMIFGF